VSVTNVFETDNTRITCYDADKPRLVISFDHWRMARHGFPDPNPSQFFAKNDMAFMTIYSARNDWFLSLDLPALKQALSQFTKSFHHITSIGYSMGGYGALLLSRATRANQVVLVSPQSSIFPDRAPFETRYKTEAAMLDPKLDTLAQKPRRGLRGTLLFDPTIRIDAKHAKIILQSFPKITATPLPFAGHPAMQTIAEAKLYRKVQNELLRKRIRPSEFLRLHKQARHSAPTYKDGLARYLAHRAARDL